MVSIVGDFDVASDTSPKEKTARDKIGREQTVDRK